MSSQWTVTPEALPGLLEAHEAQRQAAVLDGLELAAERARVAAIAATPTDHGAARRGWTVKRGLSAVELRNDAPYAEVLEKGRRPGRGWPPLAPILEWVKRHADELGVGHERGLVGSREIVGPPDAEGFVPGEDGATPFEVDAMQTARAIQRAIHARGQRPLGIVSSRLDLFAEWALEEVRAQLEVSP